jgi:hypothetical protein
VPCLVVLAGYLGPYALNCLIHPPRELPVLFFIECPEKAQSFDCIERGFTVIVSGVEFLDEVVDESLISTRISFMEHILQPVRTGRES